MSVLDREKAVTIFEHSSVQRRHVQTLLKILSSFPPENAANGGAIQEIFVAMS
jgi:hypothetical protein